MLKQVSGRNLFMNLVSIPTPANKAPITEEKYEPVSVAVTTIAVVDDHAIIRAIFKSITEDTPDLNLMWTAADLASARRQLRSQRPNLLIIDITLPDGDGFELTQEVLLTWPEIRVLVITTHEDKDYIRRARDLGASGFITKTTSPKNLLRILQRICEGEEIFGES